MLSTNKAIYVEDTFSYRDYVCQYVCMYVCNNFNTSFCARDNKTN